MAKEAAVSAASMSSSTVVTPLYTPAITFLVMIAWRAIVNLLYLALSCSILLYLPKKIKEKMILKASRSILAAKRGGVTLFTRKLLNIF